MKKQTSAKRPARKPDRERLLKQVEEIGHAFGRLDWLVTDFDFVDLATANQLSDSAFRLLERLVIRKAGKRAVNHLIAGAATGMGLERPDPKTLKYHGTISDLMAEMLKEFRPKNTTAGK